MDDTATAPPVVTTRELGTLACVGVAISVSQFLLIREFASLLYGEEVVLVTVTTSFFAALSIGYRLASRRSITWLRRALVASVLTQLAFPHGTRIAAAALSEQRFAGVWLLGLLAVHALVFAAPLAVLLPALLDRARAPAAREASRRVARLRRCYTAELLGFVAGLLLLTACFNRDPALLLSIYWALLVVLLGLVGARARAVIGVGLTALAAACALPQLLPASARAVYNFKHGFGESEVLLSIDSPYQRVEVVDRPGRGRYLYLDGLQNLNARDLAALNHYITRVPATLLRPREALIIGNGTMSSVELLAGLSGQVTSVELDPGVLRAGERFFVDPRRLGRLRNWSLHVEDAKQFLARVDRRFELIVVDVPSPLTVQEAFLHTREFYALARARLAPGGVLSVQLSGELAANNRTPARVVAALRAVFPELLVVHSETADRGFAYASDALPFTAEQVRARALPSERGLELIEGAALARRTQHATPLSLDALDVVLRRGLERALGRYFEDAWRRGRG